MLNAIVRPTGRSFGGPSCTMTVQVYGQDAIALIDTGASASAISLDCVRRIGLLEALERKTITFTNADGRQSKARGRISRLPLTIGSTTTLFDATVTDALNYDLLVGTDVLSRLKAKVDVGNGLLEIQGDPEITQVLQLQHDLLGDPAIALCSFEAYEDRGQEDNLSESPLNQLWTQYIDVVYSMPPQKPDVMGWHRQMADLQTQPESYEYENWMLERQALIEILEQQILEYYDSHPLVNGVKSFMSLMTMEAFNHIMAGCTPENVPKPGPLVPSTAPTWGQEVYDYPDLDDLLCPLPPVVVENPDGSTYHFHFCDCCGSVEIFHNSPVQSPVMCTFQTLEEQTVDLEFGKLWWQYVQAVLSMPPEPADAKGWKRVANHEDCWNWNDVCCLYDWANGHDDAIHTLKHQLLQQYESELTALGAMELMDTLEMLANNYIYSGYSQAEVVREHPEYLLASGLVQISTPQSDEAAYREAIRYLRHFQQDNGTNQHTDPNPQPGPTSEHLSTAAVNGSVIHLPVTALLQPAIEDDHDLQLVPEWDSEFAAIPGSR